TAPAVSATAASSAASAPASASAKPSASTAAPASSAAAAPASGAASAAPAGAAKISNSYSAVSADQMQPWLAIEGGFFQQKGLAVDLRLVDSAAGVPALLSGDVQIAEVGGSEVVSGIAGGADLVIIATCAPTYPYVMEVAGSIKGKDDLKGKTIGVSRFGSSSDTATRASLKKYGLDPDKDVTITQVGSASNRV